MYLYLPLPQQSHNLAKSLKGNKYILPDGQQRDEREQSLRPGPGMMGAADFAVCVLKMSTNFHNFTSSFMKIYVTRLRSCYRSISA